MMSAAGLAAVAGGVCLTAVAVFNMLGMMMGLLP